MRKIFPLALLRAPLRGCIPFIAVVIILGSIIIAAANCSSETLPVVVEVDYNEITGELNPLSGVQGSPYPEVPDDTEKTHLYRKFHIGLCRFPQDCAPNTLTLAAIFPDEKANPDSPESYRFSAIDKHILAARDAQCDILWQASYDVGMSDSWKGFNLGGRAPQDMKLWRRVVRRCLEHFNNGWSGGYHYTVRYVEFVNEPDGLGGFRGSDAPRLLPAFIDFLKEVEEYNGAHPDTIVKAAGPGIPFSADRWDAMKPHFKKLFDALKENKVNLPVLSFHSYGKDTSPAANAKLARAYRSLLDEYGMKETEVWNSEWQGPDFLSRQFHIKKRAAFEDFTEDERKMYRTGLATYALSCKIRWQGVLDGSCYYKASQRAYAPQFEKKISARNVNTAMFFPPDGSVTPLALQEKLSFDMKSRTPLRCKTVHINDNGLMTFMGSRSEKGERMSLLLCNLNGSEEKVAVKFIPARAVDTIRIQAWSLQSEEARPFREPLKKPGKGERYWTFEITMPPLESCLLLMEN